MHTHTVTQTAHPCTHLMTLEDADDDNNSEDEDSDHEYLYYTLVV